MSDFNKHKADTAINTSRLAYLEASLDQFEEYTSPTGQQFLVNKQPVYRYKEKLLGYDNLFVIELDRDIKRKLLEEYFNVREKRFIPQVQAEFQNPDQAKHIVSLLQLNPSNEHFVLIGPTIETNFRLLLIFFS